MWLFSPLSRGASDVAFSPVVPGGKLGGGGGRSRREVL